MAKFERFQDLPKEIQMMVWEYAFSIHRGKAGIQFITPSYTFNKAVVSLMIAIFKDVFEDTFEKWCSITLLFISLPLFSCHVLNSTIHSLEPTNTYNYGDKVLVYFFNGLSVYDSAFTSHLRSGE